MSRCVPCVLLLALCACSSPAPRPPGTIHDERLHALMVGDLENQYGRLEALEFELHLTPAELERQRGQRARAITTAAVRLQDGASAMLALQPELSLDTASAAAFTALARQLQDAAANLEQQARSGELQALSPLLRSLGSTCDSCHRLYRDR